MWELCWWTICKCLCQCSLRRQWATRLNLSKLLVKIKKNNKQNMIIFSCNIHGFHFHLTNYDLFRSNIHVYYTFHTLARITFIVITSQKTALNPHLSQDYFTRAIWLFMFNITTFMWKHLRWKCHNHWSERKR
jgi:hypothetical protein